MKKYNNEHPEIRAYFYVLMKNASSSRICVSKMIVHSFVGGVCEIAYGILQIEFSSYSLGFYSVW